MCGDSIVDYDKLINNDFIDLIYTDPPYGMNAVENSGVLKDKYKKIINDDSITTAVNTFNNIKDTNIPYIVFWGANYYSNN